MTGREREAREAIRAMASRPWDGEPAVARRTAWQDANEKPRVLVEVALELARAERDVRADLPYGAEL
jgi:hypothetical protein